MKKIYIISAILGLALVACNEKEISDAEKLASRPQTDLQVSYEDAGTPVEALSFTSKSTLKTIDVHLNNDHLKWNIESDRNWCVVRSEAHEGSGSFTLEIAANEDFEARDAATLTFVAGAFRGFKLRVNQNGSAFIISQPYFVVGKDGQSFPLTITVPEGTEFSVQTPDGISMDKSSDQVADGGMRTEQWTLTVGSNEGETRYEIVELTTPDGEKDQIAVAQFGTDLEQDEGGNIRFDNETPAVLTFLAPEFLIDSFVLPSYANGEVTPNGDGTVTVKISLEENYSDCSETRQSEMLLKLTNASASVVSLPPVIQDYVPAHGLVTAAGVQRFAAAVAAGESTADWETDGVVMLKGDIDMSEVTGWTGIGTAEHPFTGVFNGDKHSILKLIKAKSGFFHACDGASISNLTVGASSTIYLSGSFEDLAVVGGIADKAVNTAFTSCVYSGSMDFAQSISGDGLAYIGGIVGDGDAGTKVTNCLVDGKISLSASAAPNLTLYVGGMAGQAGTVSRNEFSGEIVCSSNAISRIAGILPSVEDGVKVADNSFLGTLTMNGNSINAVLGGLYATLSGERAFDYASDKSVVSGVLNVTKFGSGSTTRFYAGGMVGFLSEGATLNAKGYTILTTLNVNYTQALTAEYVCLGGLLGGCDISNACSNIILNNITNQGPSPVDFSTSVAISVRRTCLGGLVGLVNGPATFTDCVNQAEVGAKVSGIYSAKSNAYTMITGGIAGLCYGGNIQFDKCNNLATITNNHYSNHWLESYSGEIRSAVSTGGIMGAFNYFKTPATGITVTFNKCTSKGELHAYRGFLGGIAGFAYGAEFTDCSWEGSSVWAADKKDNQASYKGGIIGALGKGSVSGCTARGDLFSSQSGSAESADGGGMVARVVGTEAVSVSGCAYFGNMESHKTTSGAITSQMGGIVGFATENTSIADCKFGGSILSVAVSDNNVEDLAVGAGTAGSLTNITYWNGN